MPMGDSLTSGNGSTFAAYRGPLERALRNGGYSFDYVGSNRGGTAGVVDLDHEGWGGFTIGPDASSPGNLTSKVDAAMRNHRPDAVLLLAGINDFFRTGVSAADAPAKLEALVRRIQAQRPGVRIYVAGLSPVKWTAETTAMKAVSDAARRLGNASATDLVYYVDLPATRAAMLAQNGWISDQLHHNATGAQITADAFMSVIRQSLPTRCVTGSQPATTVPPTTAAPTTVAPTTVPATTIPPVTPTTVAASGSGTSVVRFEAEDAPVRHNVLVEPPGCDRWFCGQWSGRGFLGEWKNAGQYVEVPVTVTDAGTYTVRLRYAAGGGQATRELKVNGVVRPAVTFPASTNWSTWRTVDVTVQLTAGANVIRLSTDSGNAGRYVNLDSIEITR
jgi:lysophospholipase L1-like esterase